MDTPQVELIPARQGVGSDADVTLDVLVRITPPLPDVHFPRPRLNLALVLDRSGSMSTGKKMEYARQAAEFAVGQLLPEDRVSVTVFDDRVETIAPGGPAADKPGLVRRLKSVEPRGSTDLHGGWAEGGRQAAAGLVAGGINRVLLLSDGLANVGVTDPNAIAAEARGLASRGVSTTTLGVGNDYNEDLLEAVAAAGDGHYYYIESPAQLVDLFQTELSGLMATQGQRVSLGLEPGEGVAVSDVLNDFEKAPTGRLMLPNLVVGMTVQVVVRLTVPARKMSATLLNVRLAWDDPRGRGRQVLYGRLGGLPGLPRAEWEGLPVDPAVREQEALLMAARAQKEASRAIERGDLPGTRQWLAHAHAYTASAPGSAAVLDELDAIRQMQEGLDAGGEVQMRKFGKFAKFRSYLRRTGRSGTPPPPEPPKTES